MIISSNAAWLQVALTSRIKIHRPMAWLENPCLVADPLFAMTQNDRIKLGLKRYLKELIKKHKFWTKLTLNDNNK